MSEDASTAAPEEHPPTSPSTDQFYTKNAPVQIVCLTKASNPVFRWEFSTDKKNWSQIGNTRTYKLSQMQTNNEGFYRVTVSGKTSYPIYFGISNYSSIVIAPVSTPAKIKPGQTITVTTSIQSPTF